MWYDNSYFCVVQSYFEGYFDGQSDGLVAVLYVANQPGHDLLRFPSRHRETEVKAFVLLWTRPPSKPGVLFKKMKKLKRIKLSGLKL